MPCLLTHAPLDDDLVVSHTYLSGVVIAQCQALQHDTSCPAWQQNSLLYCIVHPWPQRKTLDAMCIIVRIGYNQTISRHKTIGRNKVSLSINQCVTSCYAYLLSCGHIHTAGKGMSCIFTQHWQYSDAANGTCIWFKTCLLRCVFNHAQIWFTTCD